MTPRQPNPSRMVQAVLLLALLCGLIVTRPASADRAPAGGTPRHVCRSWSPSGATPCKLFYVDWVARDPSRALTVTGMYQPWCAVSG